MNNIIAIVGPTATGKTRLGEEIKKNIEQRTKNNSKAELISIDSRQVYQGMDIGTGKDAKIFGTDLVKPYQLFNVSDFAKIIKPHIQKLWAKNILPILAGGTGLYLKAIIDEIETINIPPNEELRKELEKMTVEELQKKLRITNYELRITQSNCGMNNSDWNNPRRLIRKIEINEYYRNVGAGLSTRPGHHASGVVGRVKDPPLRINKLITIGLTASLSQLKKNIEERVQNRLDKGLLEEIEKLVEKYGWNEVLRNTIAYKEWENYFLQKSTFEECVKQWTKDEIDYAKRQMTWFKKDTRIIWIEKNYLEESLKLIEERKLLPQSLYNS